MHVKHWIGFAVYYIIILFIMFGNNINNLNLPDLRGNGNNNNNENNDVAMTTDRASIQISRDMALIARQENGPQYRQPRSRARRDVMELDFKENGLRIAPSNAQIMAQRRNNATVMNRFNGIAPAAGNRAVVATHLATQAIQAQANEAARMGGAVPAPVVTNQVLANAQAGQIGNLNNPAHLPVREGRHRRVVNGNNNNNNNNGLGVARRRLNNDLYTKGLFSKVSFYRSYGDQIVLDYNAICNFCAKEMARIKERMAEHSQGCADTPAHMKYPMDRWGQCIEQLADMTQEELISSANALLMEWSVMHSIPANAINAPVFRLLIKRLQGLETDYIVPTRARINGELLNQRYLSCIETRNDILRSSPSNTAKLQFDASKGKDAIIVTCGLKSVLYCIMRHPVGYYPAVMIFQRLQEKMREMGQIAARLKVTGLTVDRTNSMVALKRSFEASCRFLAQFCCLHLLDSYFKTIAANALYSALMENVDLLITAFNSTKLDGFLRVLLKRSKVLSDIRRERRRIRNNNNNNNNNNINNINDELITDEEIDAKVNESTYVPGIPKPSTTRNMLARQIICKHLSKNRFEIREIPNIPECERYLTDNIRNIINSDAFWTSLANYNQMFRLMHHLLRKWQGKVPTSEKLRDLKTVRRDFEEKKLDPNGPEMNALIQLESRIPWDLWCGNHLMDPRFRDDILTVDEKNAGFNRLEIHSSELFDDIHVWRLLSIDIMNMRTKQGPVWGRREFTALDDRCTIDDVFRVLNYIRADYANSIHSHTAELAVDLLSDDGVNHECERVWNAWTLLENAQNNRLNNEIRDKRAYVWNYHHLRKKTFSDSAMYAELDM